MSDTRSLIAAEPNPALYPNLFAIMAGCTSGHDTEWPAVRSELRKLCLELSNGFAETIQHASDRVAEARDEARTERARAANEIFNLSAYAEQLDELLREACQLMPILDERATRVRMQAAALKTGAALAKNPDTCTCAADWNPECPQHPPKARVEGNGVGGATCATCNGDGEVLLITGNAPCPDCATEKAVAVAITSDMIASALSRLNNAEGLLRGFATCDNAPLLLSHQNVVEAMRFLRATSPLAQGK